MSYNNKIQLNYYKIDRASKIIDCEIDDIIHLWLSGAIKLYADLKGVHCSLINHQQSDFEKNERLLQNILGGDPYKLRDLSESLRWFSYESEDVIKRQIENVETICRYVFCGKAYGLWEISPTIVTRFIHDGVFLTSMDDINVENSTNEACFVLGELFEHKGYKVFDYLSFEEQINIDKNELVITHADVDTLMSVEWSKIPSFINKLKDDDGRLSHPSGFENNIKDTPHHTTERHAKNREQILMAAMRFKEEQKISFDECCRKKDGTINYAAFARELINRPDWFLGGEAPIKTETQITKILKDAHKRPSERSK